MPEIPKNYPYGLTRKEIRGVVDSLTSELMPNTGVSLASQSGERKLLRLGKIQLGINELESRRTKKIFWLTFTVAVLSLTCSLTAVSLTYSNHSSSELIENQNAAFQKELLNELNVTNSILKTQNRYLFQLKNNLNSLVPEKIITHDSIYWDNDDSYNEYHDLIE